MTPREELRDAMVKFLGKELVGPSRADEILDESPRMRYSAGVLSPGDNRIDETADIACGTARGG